ncbi:hypothetical protein GQ53DRAFT_822911 [Thozetella sp. PMI_491]|nr:hypothetical protein GQ53DRAFT_822911 [Thozetella sp. PMI_491]
MYSAAASNHDNDTGSIKKPRESTLHVERALAASIGLSQEDVESIESFPDDRRKKMVRKLDIRLVPFLALLYPLAYIDRANIGNAKIEGIVGDLGVSGVDYNVAVSIIFFTYIIFCESAGGDLPS